MADKKSSLSSGIKVGGTPEEKKQALKTSIAQIEKRFGAGSIMRLGDNNTLNVSAVSTGSLSLDLALGIGGVPKGRIVEIYGPESSGKTTLALHILAEIQKKGGDVAFIDAEHALDPVYAKAIGVNTDELLVSQPDDGEQALEIAETLVCSGAIEGIVIDSVAALVPRAEIEGAMGSQHVGAQARLMSQALRKLSGAISKTNCIVIFINQLREKVGVFYGPTETTTGGKALKFYASVRIDVRRGEQIKVGDTVVGNQTKCKVVKNKVAPPFKVAFFDIMYGKGISKESELLDLAVSLDIIKKSGSWFSFNGTRIGQGRDTTRQVLTDNPELFAEIEKLVRANATDIELPEDNDVSDDDDVDGAKAAVELGIDISADDL